MIEALHLGPWLDEMAHRDKAQVTAGLNLLNCEDCKKRNAKEKRQMFGCGYEERTERVTIRGGGRVSVSTWAPSGYLEHVDGKRPQTCIGYTRSLQLATETTWDLVHAEEWGTLEMKYGELTEEHEARLRAARVGRTVCRSWALDNPPKKPGQT